MNTESNIKQTRNTKRRKQIVWFQKEGEKQRWSEGNKARKITQNIREM